MSPRPVTFQAAENLGLGTCCGSQRGLDLATVMEWGSCWANLKNNFVRLIWPDREGMMRKATRIMTLWWETDVISFLVRHLGVKNNWVFLWGENQRQIAKSRRWGGDEEPWETGRCWTWGAEQERWVGWIKSLRWESCGLGTLWLWPACSERKTQLMQKKGKQGLNSGGFKFPSGWLYSLSVYLQTTQNIQSSFLLFFCLLDWLVQWKLENVWIWQISHQKLKPRHAQFSLEPLWLVWVASFG